MLRILLLLLLPVQSLFASDLARTLSLGSVQDELGIDQSWEHYHILAEYMDNSEKQGSNYDKRLREVLTTKQLLRLQQLAIQTAIHNGRLKQACRLIRLSDSEQKRFDAAIERASPHIKTEQQRKVFLLRREHLGTLMTDEELEKVCGTKLHLPVAQLYSGNSSDLHAVGVDWLRCVSMPTVAKSLALTIGQRRRIHAFQGDQFKAFLKREKQFFKQAETDFRVTSPAARIRAAISKRYRDDENYRRLAKEDRWVENRKIALRITGGKDLTELSAEFKQERYQQIDEQAKFVRDFLEDLLSENQLIEVKQRVLQSAMVHGSEGLYPALRQVGIDMYRDGAAFNKFKPFSSDVHIEAMEFHVRTEIFRSTFERILGNRRVEKLLGKTHVFTGPFGEIPDTSSDLFREVVSTPDERKKNPRRALRRSPTILP